ncbi:unnamed protein product, partial [Mesorhabditis spiculigera]
MLAMNEGSGEDGSSETEMVTEQLIPTQEAKSAGTTTMAPTKEPVNSDPTNSTYAVPPPQPALDEKKPQKSHYPRTPILGHHSQSELFILHGPHWIIAKNRRKIPTIG